MTGLHLGMPSAVAIYYKHQASILAAQFGHKKGLFGGASGVTFLTQTIDNS
jgi:hypothetical protein